MWKFSLFPFVSSSCWTEFLDLASLALASLSFPLQRPLWTSIYTDEFAKAAALADTLFGANYMQPSVCEEGFLVSTFFRLVPFAIQDREGWVERFMNVIHRYSHYRQSSAIVVGYWDLLEAMRIAHAYSPIEQGVIIGIIRSHFNTIADRPIVFTINEPKCASIIFISSSCSVLENCIPILLPVRTQLKYLAFLAGGDVYVERNDSVYPGGINVISESVYNTLSTNVIATSDRIAAECLASEMVAWLDRNPYPVEHQGLETIVGHDSARWIEHYSDDIDTSYLTCSSPTSCCRGLFNAGPVVAEPSFIYPTRVTVVNYASGCCVEAQKKNSQTAWSAGANEVHALTRSNLNQEWANTVGVVHGQIGGGYWIWKPRVILDELEKINIGEVIVYLDAGNHFTSRNLTELVSQQISDVAAPFLTCCLESDWTKQDVIQELDASQFQDTPQIGAFFIIVRKSTLSLKFITEWLHACMNSHLLTDTPSIARNHPTFVKHTHDQSLFSILFKKFGFKPFPLKKAKLFVNLARWREYIMIKSPYSTKTCSIMLRTMQNQDKITELLRQTISIDTALIQESHTDNLSRILG